MQRYCLAGTEGLASLSEQACRAALRGLSGEGYRLHSCLCSHRLPFLASDAVLTCQRNVSLSSLSWRAGVKCEKLPWADEVLSARVAQLRRVLKAADELAVKRAAAQAAEAAAAAEMPGAETVPTPAPAAGGAAAAEGPMLRDPLRELPAAPSASSKKQQLQQQLHGKGKRSRPPTGVENTPPVGAAKRPCLQLPKAGGLAGQVAADPPAPATAQQQQHRMIRSIR